MCTPTYPNRPVDGAAANLNDLAMPPVRKSPSGTHRGKLAPEASGSHAPNVDPPGPATLDRVRKPNSEVRVGVRIRHARLLNGLRLREVASQVGCSESMMSKIENDRVQPSLGTIYRICKALGTNVASLLETAEPARWSILREGERPVIGHAERVHGAGGRAEVIVPFAPGRLLEGFVVVLGPRARSTAIVEHRGEEAGLIIEGRMELTLEGRAFVLEQGDSFYFPSDVPHSYWNPGDTPTRVVWINTPPTF